MLKSWFKGRGAAPASAGVAAAAITPLAPEAVYARLKEAQACMNRGDFAGARPLLEELVRCNPTEGEAQVKLGVVLYRVGELEGAVTALQAAVEQAPEHPLAFKLLASSLYKLARLPEAVPFALKSAKLNPHDWEAQNLAGSLCTLAGEWWEGARFANLALALKPDCIEALQQLDIISTNSTWLRSSFETSPKIAPARLRVCNQLLAAHRKKPLAPDQLARLLGMLEGSRETFAAALELAGASRNFEPMTTQLAEQLSGIFWSAGDLDSAVRFREFCYAEDPRCMPVRFALAGLWLMQGTSHWSESWLWMDSAQYETRPSAYVRDVPRWNGQRVGKKKILVYQEQGAGDAILCLRFLDRLAARGIRYDLWVLPNLIELAAQLTGHERLIRTEWLPTAKDHDCGFAVPLFALINALALAPEDIQDPAPWRPDPAGSAPLRQRVRELPGVRIGLMYGGNPKRRDDWLRTPPLGLARRLAAIAGISWVNLMFDSRDEKSVLVEQFGMLDPMPEVRGFADTAALISELDAVVAVDSSTAHVASCLGKPVWVLAPSFHDWRWQIGDQKSPWWPTARVLRSEAPGKFDTVFVELLAQLSAFVAAHPRHVRIGSSSADTC